MWGTPYSIRERNERDVTRRTDMEDNEAIVEIRRIRREIWRSVDSDTTRVGDSYKERQKARTAKGPAKPEWWQGPFVVTP